MLHLHKKKKIVLAATSVLAFSGAIAIGINNINPGLNSSATNVKYEFQDWIFYDPVTGSSNCNGSNYWTQWDQDTTCYRFFAVDPNEEDNDGDTIQLILDHDVGYGTFDNANNVLTTGTANWADYKNSGGTVSLMSENELASAMKLGDARPTVTIKDGEKKFTSINGGKVRTDGVDPRNIVVTRYATNALYYDNGQEVNHVGWWTSTPYDADDTYAYSVTEHGNNRLRERSDSRLGVRPVITLNKNKITGSSKDITDITNLTKNASLYKYKYSSQTYGGYTYKALQGFTMTNSNLVFYSSNNDNPNYGLVFGYTGDNFSTAVSGTPFYGATGHGNDMTFDSKRNKVLLVGPNGYNDIWVYDGDTLAHTDTLANTGTSDGSIGYDSFNDYYIMGGGQSRRVVVMDTNFNALYSIDAPFDEIGQGFEYHNGYLYQTTWAKNNCPNSYQLFCNDLDNNSSVINVYQLKFNKDGTPSKNFGRRVARLVVDGGANLAELETISFHNDEAYLGFGAQSVDSTYTYKFYHFPYSRIATDLNIDIKYEDGNDYTKVVLTSNNEQLKSVNGYTLSNNDYTLSKTVNSASVSESVNICDNYNNCTTKSIQHTNSRYGTDPTPTTRTISFANSIVNKNATDPKFTITATMNGDGNITYTSSNSTIASVNASTGEVTINKAGTVTITATAPPTENYTSGSASYTLIVSKTQSTKPQEADVILEGLVGSKLSTVTLSTNGLSWSNGNAVIAAETNEYEATYTQNNDTNRYTTVTFMIKVHGTNREYEVIEGGDQEYTVGEDDSAAVFRINAEFALFENNGSVRVDNIELTKDQYTATSGSTIITLNKDFVDTLDAGEHTLQALFNDGGVANTTFTVTKSGTTPDPDPTPKSGEKEDLPVPSTSSSEDSGKTSTSDNNNIALFIAPIVIGSAVLIYRKMFSRNKKRRFDK